MGHRPVKRVQTQVYADEQSRARQLDEAHVWIGTITACAYTSALSSSERGWSPEQVAGPSQAGSRQDSHFTREHLSVHLCPAWRVRRTTGWRRYLPRAKSKRGWRGRRGRQPGILHRSCARPTRRTAPRAPMTDSTPGHWEADLMLFQDLRTGGTHPARATLSSSSSPVRLPGKASQIRSPAPSPQVLAPLPAAAGGGRSPSTTGPSSHAIYRLHDLGISRPSSAILVPLGRRAVSRTPTAACGALCRAR